MTVQGNDLVNRTPWYLGWLCAAVLVHQPAQAEEELSDASARVFREAIAAADKKQWAECRTKTVGVWQQVKNANIAGLLGICEAELGMHRDAAEHLDYFFANQKGTAQAQVDQAKTRFDAVRPKVVLVEVTPIPEDAFVVFQGAPVGKGKRRLWVEPGDVVLGIAKDGESKSQTIQVVGGDTRAVTIELPQSAGAGPAGTGGAGTGAGSAGAGGAGADGAGAGGSGGAGEDDAVPAWLGWVLGGSGLAAAGVGAALFGVAQGKLGDASTIGDELANTNGECLEPQGDAVAQCEQAATLVDDAGAMRIAGGVLVGVGVAAIVGAIVVWTIPGDDAKATAMKMQLWPWSDGQSGGLVMRGVY
jgi:hypothetical protein